MGLFGKPADKPDKFASGASSGEAGAEVKQAQEPPAGLFPGMPGQTPGGEAPVMPGQNLGAPEPEPVEGPPMGFGFQGGIPEGPAEDTETGGAGEGVGSGSFSFFRGGEGQGAVEPYPPTEDAPPQPEAAPLYDTQPLGPYADSSRAGQNTVESSKEFQTGAGPCFTKVQPQEENYAGKFALDMPHVEYIGMTEVLLKTLRDLEQKYKISMPIRSCGLDPIVFSNAAKNPELETTKENLFVIKDGDKTIDYELMEVDGELYASCMSAPLDTDFLHSVIREATMAMTEQGHYIFYMVGLCVLAGEGDEPDSLMRTLRLNSYELSVLCNYMESFGTEVEYGTCDGRQCIYFRAKS